MAITAMGENVDQYWQQAGCELISWSNELYNHTSITKDQKEKGITAHQDQYGGEEDLEAANEIPIRTWGELTYIYVKKKDRHGKLSPRAIRCIWNGRNQDNIKSISGIPIVAVDGKWQLQKPIHSAQAVTIRGCFPLRDTIDTKLPEPPDTTLMLASDIDIDPEAAEDEHGEFEVEKVVEHNDLHDDSVEYKLRWKGYDPTHDTWHHQDDCKECMKRSLRW